MNRPKIKWGKIDLMSLIIILIPITLTLYLYNRLPNQLAVHFGTNGEANGYQGKFSFLLTSVLFLIGIPLLLKITRYIDPKRKNYDKFETTFDMFRLIFTAFLSVMYISMIYINLGYSVNIQMIVLIGIGLLFMYLGKTMSRIHFNYTMGIRTPWTLASEDVWQRTHRFAGPLWFIGGIVILILAFLPGSLAFIILLIIVAIIAIVPILYSYFIYKKD